LGSKFYNHPYVGTESQPTARLLWKAAKNHTFWTAFTEARRIPSSFDRNVSFTWNVLPPSPPTGLPVVLEFAGSQNFKSEVMKGREIGYRYIPSSKFSLDLTLFQQEYLKLIYADPGSPIPVLTSTIPYIGVLNSFTNAGRAIFRGLESSVHWQPLLDLQINAAFTSNLKEEFSQPFPGGTPSRQWFIRCLYQVNDNLEFITSFQNVGKFSYLANLPTAIEVPGYSRFDTIFTWKTGKGLEISLGGQNLLNKYHQEFGPTFTEIPTEVPRNYFLKATWTFK
jgi:iron complex outermembrane receptor protein